MRIETRRLGKVWKRLRKRKDFDHAIALPIVSLERTAAVIVRVSCRLEIRTIYAFAPSRFAPLKIVKTPYAFQAGKYWDSSLKYYE